MADSVSESTPNRSAAHTGHEPKEHAISPPSAHAVNRSIPASLSTVSIYNLLALAPRFANRNFVIGHATPRQNNDADRRCRRPRRNWLCRRPFAIFFRPTGAQALILVGIMVIVCRRVCTVNDHGKYRTTTTKFIVSRRHESQIQQSSVIYLPWRSIVQLELRAADSEVPPNGMDICHDWRERHSVLPARRVRVGGAVDIPQRSRGARIRVAAPRSR